MTAADGLLLYGDGVPRYLTLWVPLAVLLVAVLLAARVRGRTLLLVLVTTLPPFGLHSRALPGGPPVGLGWSVVVAVVVVAAAVLVRALRRPAAATPAQASAARAPAARAPAPFAAAAALAVLAVAVRAVLTLVDPGSSDILRSGETAARDLLAGSNPYLVVNEHSVVGTYQYPAASLLWHVPTAALLPQGVTVLGESWVAGRLAVAAADVLVVGLLAVGLARLGRRRAGLVAAAAYALHPALARDSGLTGANDVLLAAALLGVALLLAGGRGPAAGVVLGLAVSVKPVAVVALPVVLLGAGVGAAGLAAAVALALQAPFWLLPRPGLHGLSALSEPAGRPEDYDVLRRSLWWPLYALAGDGDRVVAAVTVLAVLVAVLVAVRAGVTLRRSAGPVPGPGPAVAAVTLPLLVLFALASVWRPNFEAWWLLGVLAAVVLVGEGAPSPRRGARAGRRLVPGLVGGTATARSASAAGA